MPWHVENNHPDCSGYAVVKDSDGSVAGCHMSEGDAMDQMAALYAQEADRARLGEREIRVSDTPWSNFTEADYTPEQFRRACLIDTEQGDPDSKSRYKIPVREPGGALNRGGVHAAAGGHGIGAVTGVSADKKRVAARKLVGHYRNDLNEDPPDSLLRLAGMSESNSQPRRREGLLGPRDRRLLPPQVVERLAEGFGEEALAVAHRGFDIDYRGKRFEHRATRGYVELRDAEGGDPILHGYATVHDEAYPIWGGPPVGFIETVEPGSAQRSIDRNDDVYMFFDHDGLPLAATKASTLTLRDEKRGLYNEAHLDRASPYSMEIVSRVARGELDAMSFAFEVVEDDWNSDYTERTIRQYKLFDVSVVSFPANPATVVGLRSNKPSRTGMSLSRARAEMEALALRVK